MPKVDKVENLEPMYCKKKFGERGSINLISQLNAIKVTIVDAPTVEQMRQTLAVFMNNSWSERPRFDGFTEAEIDKCISELFSGKILPSGMETIGITWCVEGLDLIDVTHLIRHRMFTFSAQCSDRDLRDLDVLVKPSIMLNDQFIRRYIDIVRQQHELYTDMMDSGEICTFDARTVLPISKSHFYNVRCCIKDLLAFVKQRQDEQIQTQVDNIVALKLWLEVVKLYPFLKSAFNPRQKSAYYISQCKAGKTTIFPPNENNDVFDWSEDQFFHDKHRDEFSGGEVYLSLRDNIIAEIEAVDKEVIIYACEHIGVSGTTKMYIKQTGETFEARIGIAILGSTNVPIDELANMNPFDESFNDNFARGYGDSKEAAIEACKASMDQVAKSIW